MSYISHERTHPRFCPQVRPYQVPPQSEKNCTRESVNGLSRSKWLISSLRTHLTSYVSHERTCLRSCPQVRPYQVWPQSEKNCTRESVNGLSRSKQLISSLSAHLMSYISYERTQPRPCPQVRPYQVWPQSEKNCSRESVNGVVSTDGQTDNLTSLYPCDIAPSVNDLVDFYATHFQLQYRCDIALRHKLRLSCKRCYSP